MASWIGLEGGPTGPKDVATFASIEGIFSNLLGVLTAFIGIAVFVMIIIGGVGLLTSGGDPEKVKKSGQAIFWSMGGLIMMILIWFILRLIEQFTGVNITLFRFPS